MTDLRVGLGYDSHAFDALRLLVLGGVHIPDHPGLRGHSDGDAVAHAVIDAILGAANIGDVGSLFPPSDPEWKGADSIDLLRRSTHALHQHGYRVVNVDIAVVCETPKIAPHAQAMSERLGKALAIPSKRVSVKGKTNERLGWIGEGKGLAVHAVALIQEAPKLDDTSSEAAGG
ncbi:MAG: 2-C-methyl-D-erythritol 2,4-cyclodiphosphate synthase [Longimicrobiales bacterium]|nr:2-C-methyl-D-erythritol 2,4-cyclodiphosphate synthase [Longimicrobiales bacterium]